MNDNLPTVWPAEPHTLAKHAILSEYLKAWMPIMVRHSAKLAAAARGEVLYVDGFAGPGRYQAGEDGSPILALRLAMNHEAEFPVPIRFLFIELDKDRWQSLCDCIERETSNVRGAAKVRIEPPIQGDCTEVLSGILDAYRAKGTKFGPALVFLDQFGYSLPMNLITQIMAFPSCEVLSYLEYAKLNRFLTDPNKHPTIDRAFGDSNWKAAINLPAGQRDKRLLHEYKSALRARGNAKYVSHFSMHDANGQLIYWLFFSTNHMRGLEEMKKAMWKVDGTGAFRFSDSDDPSQQSFFLNDSYNEAWLAETLAGRFRGTKVRCGVIKEFVLVETPCIHYRNALGILWRRKCLRSAPHTGAKPPAFDGHVEVEFVEPPKTVQEGLFL